MKIPIFNSIYSSNHKTFKSKNLNLSILNDLKLKKINSKQFPLIKILGKLHNKDSLYETIIVTVNDYFVSKFLNNEIGYKHMIKLIYKYCNYKKFLKYRKNSVQNVEDIYKLRDYVRLKLTNLGV